MNRPKARLVVVLLLLALTTAACSRRGVHMPRHRKKAKCDCPTFAVYRGIEQYDSVMA